MIEVEGLAKTFHVHEKAPGLMGSIRALFSRKTIEKPAVKGVDFTVAEGEIVGLLGANGAGKTTIVKMLAGIVHPTSGEARVLGHRPWERADAFRAQIALIMGQKASLWWDLPAADCFLLLKEVYRIPDERYRHTLDALTEILGVGPQLGVQIRRLSLGERMKMELIAALLHGPKVVFLDEPTIGLDLTAQRAIREFLLAYRAEHRPAMILTSHYMEDIQRLCQRILILRQGSLVYDGPLAEVVARYAPDKLLTVQLRGEGEPATAAPPDLSGCGVVVRADPDQVQLRVPRAEVARVATHLLQALPVHDLAIAEDDVGAIIERLMGAHGHDAVAGDSEADPTPDAAS